MTDLLFTSEPEITYINQNTSYGKMKTMYMNKLTIDVDDDTEIIGNISVKHRMYTDKAGKFDRWGLRPINYAAALEACLKKYRFALSDRVMIFHNGKMTSGPGIPNSSKHLDGHSADVITDNEKFRCINNIIERNQRLKKVNQLYFTQIALTGETWDPFGGFNGMKFITKGNEIYSGRSLICEADVYQFYNKKHERKGFFSINELGHMDRGPSISQDLEDFYALYFETIFCQKNGFAYKMGLTLNELNMTHFEKLNTQETSNKMKWLRHQIKLKKELIGNVIRFNKLL